MICGSHRESVASRASAMLIYNCPYIILVATGDRAYVNLHPWIWQGFPVITYLINSSQKWPQVGHFEFDQIEIPRVYSHLKPPILFNSNGLAIRHGFPVITHIEVKSGRRSAISLLDTAHFVYSNGLAIWSGFPYIPHIKIIMADNWPFCTKGPSFCPNSTSFKIIWAISEIDTVVLVFFACLNFREFSILGLFTKFIFANFHMPLSALL